MKYLDCTHPAPEHNLAIDEALLDEVDAGIQEEVLRTWMPLSHFVVVGYGNTIDAEVHREACLALGIPIYRRCSGGGTVLQGPGCLNYSLVLCLDGRPELVTVSGTNRFIMNKIKSVIEPILGPNLHVKGITDLAICNQKIAGNAQRRKRHSILFHGCFLLDFDIQLMSKVLKSPSKQPEYRENRSHIDFVINCLTPAVTLKSALRQEWDASEELVQVPEQRIERLVREKYSQPQWNNKF